jgi:bacterial leucyl aminopeptidase
MKKAFHLALVRPTRPALLALLVASTLGLCNSSMAAEKKVWITVGDEAYGHLQALAPKAVASASKVINNGSTGLIKQEKVHLVQVDEALLPAFSESLHSKSHRCGGYVYHPTQAAGLSALNKTTIAPSLAAVRPSYALDNATAVNAALPLMSASNIGQTITDLSTGFKNRYYTTSGGTGASTWLLNKWQSMATSAGRSDISVSQFTHPNWPQKSVILTINGTDNASEVVVIGGHLDSINSGGTSETTLAPGADDDASGIASMTEVYRALLASGYKPRRTIKFMAYAAEEVGLRGSAEIAANFKANNVKVVGVMQLDMTNYKGAANDIYIFTDYTDSAQNTFVENLIKTYQPTLTIGRDVCNYGCSDHASWTSNGFYASMPFESSMSTSNSRIHTINDTFANMGSQATHSLKFAKLAASFAIELGSDGPGVLPPPDTVATYSGSLAKGASKSFGPFKVGAGGAIKASTTGTGDMDLYVRKTSVPTTTTYTCKSAGSTATETCTVSYTTNGDAYVLVYGYTAGTYNLTVSYRPQ